MMDPDDIFEEPLPVEYVRAKRLRGAPKAKVRREVLPSGCVVYWLPATTKRGKRRRRDR
jgi:hypothetical protein